MNGHHKDKEVVQKNDRAKYRKSDINSVSKEQQHCEDHLGQDKRREGRLGLV